MLCMSYPRFPRYFPFNRSCMMHWYVQSFIIFIGFCMENSYRSIHSWYWSIFIPHCETQTRQITGARLSFHKYILAAVMRSFIRQIHALKGYFFITSRFYRASIHTLSTLLLIFGHCEAFYPIILLLCSNLVISHWLRLHSFIFHLRTCQTHEI